ncbi:hypothetical protein CP973_19450 [Streptomyces albofaciens JCM 4342]|uniref:hypothetical protein n=1 Tax=Streptomyces albofaciens TaxID=66866 RepID=UPI001238ADFB|nr:hypothetical protein [Streptomyces albofaciens]KAA6223808.1 hypothetical protein CP973_19450 [Streptomyces albofaciens JCM 4342]
MNRSSLAVSMAAAVVLALQPGTASATRGLFTYTPPPVEEALQAPRVGTCYTMDGDGPAENQTRYEAELFRGANCSGLDRVLRQGQRHRNAVFSSARFVGHGSAGGYFSYSLAPLPEALENPQADRCIDIRGEGRAANRTDKVVLLFSRPGCPGTANAKIYAHERVSHSRFESVEFVS